MTPLPVPGTVWRVDIAKRDDKDELLSCFSRVRLSPGRGFLGFAFRPSAPASPHSARPQSAAPSSLRTPAVLQRYSDAVAKTRNDLMPSRTEFIRRGSRSDRP